MMPKSWRVVATGPWERPGWQAPLEEAGCEVVLGRSFDQFPGLAYSDEELIELLADADAVLVSTRERLSRRVLEALPRLKIVAKATIGVEKIDLEAAADRGILVVNSPAPENFLSVAEAAVGLIVVLAKRVMVNQRRLREGEWKAREFLGTLLAGKTIGIVGLGRVGSNVARRLTGWDVQLLAADPYVEPAQAYAVGAELVPLEDLLRTADAVTLHVVETAETSKFINEARLRLMKPTAYLVNTSRGGVIDEVALARALDEGWIAGAALDVFQGEPLPADSPLRQVDPDRLIITPHAVGSNIASQETGTRMAMENILRALRGERPSFIKNPRAVDAWQARLQPVAVLSAPSR
jgi:D-3-phosphoglycerate dehydrogenase / 2-oxoglutarate reductase